MTIYSIPAAIGRVKRSELPLREEPEVAVLVHELTPSGLLYVYLDLVILICYNLIISMQ